MENKKEIVIISGKGGTGKTTVAAGLADLLPNKIIVDADVDAANMHILLKVQKSKETEFSGMFVAHINANLCNYCGLCQDLCRFNAIQLKDGIYEVQEISCEGCGLCKLACPVEAVTLSEQIAGSWFHSKTGSGDFFHARLIPGAENSGQLVVKIRDEARLLADKKQIHTLLIDGPPGIGCPVIAAISGTDLAIIVTEPTFSGLHDLKRIYELTKHFNIKCGLVINRFDINSANTRLIEKFAEKEQIRIFAKIPHLNCVIREIANGNNPSIKCNVLNKKINQIKIYLDQELDRIKN